MRGLEMAAAAFIDGELTKAPLVIFSKTTCGYCSQVKRMVGGLALPVPAHVVELNQLDNMSELQDRYTTLFGCLAAWLAGRPRVPFWHRCTLALFAG